MKWRVAFLFVVAVAAAEAARPHARLLRVCADPNNLPFSNAREEGFENRLAQLIANDLHARVEYTWWAQRRGFFRNTLNNGLCDVVPGMASSVEFAWATRPYYRSTYVFVTRRDRHISIRSLDDTLLKRLRIGVQLIGDDYSNTPPVDALARRGLSSRLVGFRVVGDYSKPNPPERIMDAVVHGDVDVAVVWGPLAGNYARRTQGVLELAPVSPQVDTPFLPFVFDVSMAVRRGDSTLHRDIERVLVSRRPTIDSLLAAYGVPRVDRQ